MSNRSTHLAHPPHHADTPAAPEHSGRAITIVKVQPYQGETIIVTSDAVDMEGRLDAAYAQGGDANDASPPLAWTAVAEAQAYALVVEDPDAPRDEPVLHWMMWDIPGEVSALQPGVAKAAHPFTPQDVVQGLNAHGEPGWIGPKPPPGHGPHRYHFQLFALAKRLQMGPETTLADLTTALKGVTIASGELVATFETPDEGAV